MKPAPPVTITFMCDTTSGSDLATQSAAELGRVGAGDGQRAEGSRHSVREIQALGARGPLPVSGSGRKSLSPTRFADRCHSAASSGESSPAARVLARAERATTALLDAGPRRPVARLAVASRCDHAGVVEEVGASVGAVAGDAGVETRTQLEIGAEERCEVGVDAEVAAVVRAEQSDQRLGDDPPADGSEVETVGHGFGFGEDVVPERGARREWCGDA